MKPLTVGLDTNCFIDAINEHAREHNAMKKILAANACGRLELWVSRHSISELEKKRDAAYDLALSVGVLPHYPFGRLCDQVAKLDEVSGTWEDVARHDAIAAEIKQLARAGVSLRDRGAYVDSLHARMSVFVTSDRDLVDEEPARRLSPRFKLRICRPSDLAGEL